ncbi:four-carbon acid sugar kinase family protein [Postechiella marina]|uniref:Four-carbon acid sugar kinase family protein n=1 Tax=Postechiella marina TaxID=943941 RepID=A0ABP8C3C9_9FLAO
MGTVLSNILKELPEEDKTNYRAINSSLFKQNNKVCIIVDDDPTGNQTVYNVPLLTSWNLDVFITEFKNKTPVFFVLTNSRSLSAAKTLKIYKDIAQKIEKASKLTKQDFTLVSRSDSTLRGHFPLEPNTLKEYANLNESITVFIPVMFEGGRVTVNNTHYVLDNQTLTPVSETPFAKDHSFAYSNSNLKSYIEEKTEGNVEASGVHSFSLNTIRTEKSAEIANQIIALPANTYCVFNSINYQDLDKVTHALLLAEKLGKKIVYRTSSSFVPSYIGLPPKSLLSASDLVKGHSKNGGLTIVGSYVKKSSEQLQSALTCFNKESIVEVDVNQIITDQNNSYKNTLVHQINTNISAGKDVIVFTSRTLITGANTASTIQIASKISQALVYLVNTLSITPRYLIAKGGITSHDIATKGLGMKRSKVLGQLLPGIPVWEMGDETKFSHLPYVVFPGNVGNTDSLQTIIKKLAN